MTTPDTLYNSNLNLLKEQLMDKKRLVNLFNLLTDAIDQDSSVFSSQDSAILEDLQVAVASVASFLHSDLLRGSDYLSATTTSYDADMWLKSNPRFKFLGTEKQSSKFGRFGAVVAMHPRRDELAQIVSEDIAGDPYLRKLLPHLSRLLTHDNAQACESFVIDVLSYPEFFQIIPENTDGTDSFIFWTYGPYVLQELKKIGGNYDDLINHWLVNRKKSKIRGNALYPGIDYMYESQYYRMHYLAKDGSHPSHQFIIYLVEKLIIPQLKPFLSN